MQLMSFLVAQGGGPLVRTYLRAFRQLRALLLSLHKVHSVPTTSLAMLLSSGKAERKATAACATAAGKPRTADEKPSDAAARRVS